ncbi:DHS-like NAD/FAD-binding domain-containing protein [Epithele typhae]|uniref:DHS-like NAD/FAD-binding domain-containing protein n=1 Tax=Epithele typhae TaxID=378194 RepID=UPI002007E702|nr:DHS-like NAD/FAD-binding domain-containing protein [Epithele typhae]KAH9922865.1 DHS-like NAD/FAD-binding domain-containing protein [Epithele typhae]
MDDEDELLMLYDGPTVVLEDRDVRSIAKYMKSPQCKRVFVILGSGVSVASGIPDFKSPKTGLYASLAQLNLPYPRAVLELNYFRFNPLPFYKFTRELYPRRFRPTLTHSFVKLLADRGLLHTCFTQNIDTLERQAGIPPEQLVEAHGSFASQRCIDCKRPVDDERMRAALEEGRVLYCENAACKGLVKPDVVFFGESMPEALAGSMPKIDSADLLFVVGTSLTVQPFAKLAALAPAHCPRVLINLDFAGDIGMRPDDVLLFGKCDDVLRDLARALDWEEDLDAEWVKTALSPDAAPPPFPVPENVNVLRAVAPHEQVEMGKAGSPGTNTPTSAEWAEKLVVTESLSERLRMALESSEKIVPLLEDAAVAFAARTLSAEELVWASNVACESPVNDGLLGVGVPAIAVMSES